MKDIKLKIAGMHCTGCSSRLEKVLNNIEGVEKAKVSFEEEEAVITYDNEKVSEKQIIIEIEEAGFKAEKQL